jgi:hypothetical protein
VPGVRVRLFKWAVILFLIVFAIGGAFFGPAIFTDLTSRNGTFATVKRRYERIKGYITWKSPEQKRLLKTFGGHPPGANAPDPSGPRIITPRR